MPRFNAYRDGMVHVCRTMCKTCIYRNDSPVFNTAIKKKAVEEGTAVICHSTLDTKEHLVCRGFLENDKTPLLEIAQRIGAINFVAPPEK